MDVAFIYVNIFLHYCSRTGQRRVRNREASAKVKREIEEGGGGGVRVLVNVTSICAFFLVLATSSVYLGRDQSCWFITRGECVRFVFRLLINVFDVSIVQSEQRE